MDISYSSSAAQVIENTSTGIEDTSVERPLTPEPVQRSQPESSNDRNQQPSLQEILQMTSTTVNFISTITTLFNEKGEQNLCFREELRRKNILIAMNAHAWASARLVHEHKVAGDTLGAGIQKLLKDEENQGRSSHPVFRSTFDRIRAHLSEMFEAINNTVASLTGLS
ncbi:uncharacterized protein HD556DRAFT_1413100 [Suillus plorans]|uniref:Uncharacterized protein n=1 Tax=Suillus plorans TaxID=116603 RepID=A0A9P7AD25_9AGAM|nr:uncharacterized protein HD556DRAFT_1413100 [Suillus plorans]KAG1786871.1 hypothetical protein HD556DRAFT_1413100 [Suillus plorans]